MELANQIKKYRTELNISQEELAEKIYVSRQTISNWENDKNYPDINSLIRLSEIFGISLDTLIKGDIEVMREEIKREEIQAFNKLGIIYTILFFIMIVSSVPLIVFMGGIGIAIWAAIVGVTMYVAMLVEKEKKKYDIQTYREIVAFQEGKQLDELEKAVEVGKRKYEKILFPLGAALIALIICVSIGLVIIFLM